MKEAMKKIKQDLDRERIAEQDRRLKEMVTNKDFRITIETLNRKYVVEGGAPESRAVEGDGYMLFMNHNDDQSSVMMQGRMSSNGFAKALISLESNGLNIREVLVRYMAMKMLDDLD